MCQPVWTFQMLEPLKSQQLLEGKNGKIQRMVFVFLSDRQTDSLFPKIQTAFKRSNLIKTQWEKAKNI